MHMTDVLARLREIAKQDPAALNAVDSVERANGGQNKIEEHVTITTTDNDAVLSQMLKLAGMLGGEVKEVLPPTAPGSDMGGTPEMGLPGGPVTEPVGPMGGGIPPVDADMFGGPPEPEDDPWGIGLPGEDEINHEDPLGLANDPSIGQDVTEPPAEVDLIGGPGEPANDDMGAMDAHDEIGGGIDDHGIGHGSDDPGHDEMDADFVMNQAMGDDESEHMPEIEEDHEGPTYANTPDEHTSEVDDVLQTGDSDEMTAHGTPAISKPKSLRDYIKQAERSLGEGKDGFPHDVDHMPGATRSFDSVRVKPWKHCERCKGGKTVVKDGKKYKCGACKGMGYKEIAESAEKVDPKNMVQDWSYSKTKSGWTASVKYGHDGKTYSASGKTKTEARDKCKSQRKGK